MTSTELVLSPRSTQCEYLNAQYNVRHSVTDFERYTKLYRDLSDAAFASLQCYRDIPFGAGGNEKLDIFPAAHPDAPVLLFIHGGYWKALSKADSAFMAPALTAAGACVVVLEYDLVPDVDLDTIVSQVRRALAWVYQNICRYGGDPRRIFASGNSAGGHLVGMLLAGGWQSKMKLPTDVLRGAIPISGIFDLEPLRHTFVNDWMQLSETNAWHNSPLFSLPTEGAGELFVCYGSLESDEFARQSTRFLEAWQAAGFNGHNLISPDKNHFDVVLDLADAHSPLFKAVCKLMRLQPGPLRPAEFQLT